MGGKLLMQSLPFLALPSIHNCIWGKAPPKKIRLLISHFGNSLTWLNHNENCIGTGGGKRTRFPCFISEERQIKRESFPFTHRLPNTGITAMKDDFKRFQSKILFWKKKEENSRNFWQFTQQCYIYIFPILRIHPFLCIKDAYRKRSACSPEEKENKFFGSVTWRRWFPPHVCC